MSHFPASHYFELLPVIDEVTSNSPMSMEMTTAEREVEICGTRILRCLEHDGVV
jgi:hypothetical protein